MSVVHNKLNQRDAQELEEFPNQAIFLALNSLNIIPGQLCK